MICSFITWTATAVYFDSISYTQSCFQKDPPENSCQQIQNFLLFDNVMFDKNFSGQLFWEVLEPLSKWNCNICVAFLKIHIFSRNQQAWSREPQTEWGSQKVLRDKLSSHLPGWFGLVMEFVDNKKKYRISAALSFIFKWYSFHPCSPEGVLNIHNIESLSHASVGSQARCGNIHVQSMWTVCFVFTFGHVHLCILPV